MAELLVLEPYYGGSHQQLVETLLARLREGSYHMASLPAKKWHWRARTSALSLSQDIPLDTSSFKVLFTSSVLNLAELLGLRPDLVRLRKIVYFHENQLVYPVQTVKERDFQFGYNHITTCLAADLVIFNSGYNKTSFLENIRKFLRLQPDHRPNTDVIENQIRQKSMVVYFPLSLPPLKLDRQPGTPLHLVWPHRWEHDKDPATFLRVLDRLMESGEMFLVSILGQVYSEVPQVLQEAKLRLEDRLVMFGAPPTREEYYSALARCDVVVSTALHETYGVAVMEATALGCRPLVPDRLVYPEIYPAECLYTCEDQLYLALLGFIRDPPSVSDWEQIDFDKFTGERPLQQLLDCLELSPGELLSEQAQLS